MLRRMCFVTRKDKFKNHCIIEKPMSSSNRIFKKNNKKLKECSLKSFGHIHIRIKSTPAQGIGGGREPITMLELK